MRKHDYELIAQSLKNARPTLPGIAMDTWVRTVKVLASDLELESQAFSYQLFLHNAGVN